MGTPMMKNHGTCTEHIGVRGEPRELKHLSTGRKRNQTRFREEWRAKMEEAKPIVEIPSGLGLQTLLLRVNRITWESEPKGVRAT